MPKHNVGIKLRIINIMAVHSETSIILAAKHGKSKMDTFSKFIFSGFSCKFFSLSLLILLAMQVLLILLVLF